MKKCTKCGEEKPQSEYYKGRFNKNTNTQYYNSQCKACTNAASNKHYDVGDRRKNKHYKNRYGITYQDKIDLYASQNGCCKICGDATALDKIHLDHCHSTGEVRGLLCHGCNIGLGMFKDNTETLLSAIQYIKEAQNGSND